MDAGRVALLIRRVHGNYYLKRGSSPSSAWARTLPDDAVYLLNLADRMPARRSLVMNHTLLLTISVLGLAAVWTLAVPQSAQAVTCANGVYRAGCAGPNGAVVVRKPPPLRQQTIKCANGVYRAGCVGPNGAAVMRKY